MIVVGHKSIMRWPVTLYGAVLLALVASAAKAPGFDNQSSPAHNFSLCDSVEESAYIVVNVAAGQIVLRTADSVLVKTRCSAGSGGRLRDSATGRVWDFTTPTGTFSVTAKAENPIWNKPDWAYIEERLAIPDDPAQRLEKDQLGGYSLSLGDGLYIHGTVYTRLLGMNVTHGCIRVADEDLEKIYYAVEVGTPVFIF